MQENGRWKHQSHDGTMSRMSLSLHTALAVFEVWRCLLTRRLCSTVRPLERIRGVAHTTQRAGVSHVVFVIAVNAVRVTSRTAGVEQGCTSV